MKKKRIISIRDPKLKKIRDNLRLLLLKWKRVEWNQSHDEYEELRFDKNDHPIDLTGDERKRVDVLLQRMRILDEASRKSLCKCTKCLVTDKDMVYNPPYQGWFCVECYNDLHEYYKDKEESYLFP